MTVKKGISQKELERIKTELSMELEKMSPEQRKAFFEGAKEVVKGLAKTEKVRALISA